MNVVTPEEGHREQIATVLATSVNVPLAQALQRAPVYQIDRMRVALRDDAVVATAGAYRFDQWFGGRPVASSGIWGVATLPEHRGEGLATACVRAVLDDARHGGTPLSTLFPALLTPYRKMGYELAGAFVDHRVPLDALPDGGRDLPPVSLVDPERDLPGIREAYRTWVRTENGPTEPLDDDQWHHRFFERPDDTFRAVVVREGDRVTGFAAVSRVPDPGPLDVGFGLECALLFAVTGAAWHALFGYFRGHRGLGKWLQWPGPSDDPIAIDSADTFLERPFRHDWMLRLLDVPAAFEQRGYPPVDADVVFCVDDALYPENAGPWRVEVRGGVADVKLDHAESCRPIPVGALSSLFSGYLRPRDAVRLGHLDADDPAVDAFTRLLSGPDPWTPFFF